VPHDILPLRMRGDGELEAEEEEDIYMKWFIRWWVR
jgi:hypothetical protein